MKKSVKTILASAISVALLAGCSSDDKDDIIIGTDGERGEIGDQGPAHGSEGDRGDIGQQGPDNGAEGGKTFDIYGKGASGTFHMQVTDSDGITYDIPANLGLEAGNITTSPVPEKVPGRNGKAINIDIDKNASGTVLVTSANGSFINLSKAAENGTLQFDLKVNEKPTKGSEAFIRMGDNTRMAPSVNISRALNAYTGGSKQTVSIPLSCFAEQGFDFSNTYMPFALHTSDNLNIDIDNVRFISETAGDRYDLSCEQFDSSEITNAGNSVIFAGQQNNENWVGWGRQVRTWGKPEITTERQGIALKTTFDSAKNGERGGVLFNVVSGQKNKDWSQLVEEGVLTFQLRVDNYATHPSRQLRVSFETPHGTHNSNIIALDEGCADNAFKWVEVPVKELITNAEGKVDTNIIQNISSALNIAPVDVSNDDTIEGMEFRINNIQLAPTSLQDTGDGYCVK